MAKVRNFRKCEPNLFSTYFLLLILFVEISNVVPFPRFPSACALSHDSVRVIPTHPLPPYHPHKLGPRTSTGTEIDNLGCFGTLMEGYEHMY